ncbi:MAG: DUF5689 domain-containing protein [Bacteroidales bacterium]|nr:DUF5689 domain-containing protein [Bacteroidales bacterium]
MKKLALIIIGISLIFVSCKKELDTPNLKPFPSGETQTVADLLEKIEQNGEYQFDTVKDASVEGWVIADEKSGNIYRTFYLRDNTGAIAVYRPSGSDDFDARTGDLVKISLKGAILGSYNGLPQIQLQEEKTNSLICIKQRDGIINPTVTTLADITQGKHLCDLVMINGVEFSDYEGHTYAENGANTNHGIEDCNGYSCIVRTSSYATFANDSLPKGKGSLICIVSLYRTDWQLLIRNTNDVNMNGPRCGQIGGQPQEMPYEQPFATSFGTYSTYDVAGEQSWGIDFSTAKMTGFVDQVNYANEDWLISSPVNVTNVSHAKLTMNYIARYFSNLNHDVTIQVSTDYVFESDPTTATWEQLEVELTESTSWNDFMTAEAVLDKYIGQQIWVAVKYLSTDSKAGTIEIQSISITEGDLTPPAQTIFSEPFSSGQGDFTIQNVFMAQGLSWVWNYKSPYGMVASAFANNTSYESESWLISPAIDMNGFSSAVLTFEHAANKLNGSPADYYSVWVSTDYTGGLPDTATWTQLTVPTYPAGTNWTFVASGDIDMSAYLGNSNVRIAFRYTSEDGNSGSWEIKNVLINE